MFAVAITRWGPPLDQEAASLAPLLKLTAYDAKLRLGGPTPVVFARVEESGRARELLAVLRERGHRAVACKLDLVPSSATMATPRGYELGADTFVALDPSWGRRAIPYGEIVALVRAVASSSEQLSSVSVAKKFSLGRAVLSSGLVRNKATTVSTSSTSEQREQVLYVIPRGGHEPLLLREGSVRHEGLGEQRQPTALLNFAAMVEALRARAPKALYDERLLKQRRKSGLQSVVGGSKHRVATSGNASENDLAAYLIAMAYMKGQL